MAWLRSPTSSLICKNGSIIEIQSFRFYIYCHNSRTQIHSHFRGTLIITGVFFTIFNCKQSSMAMCQTYTQPHTLANSKSYGQNSMPYNKR